MSGLVPFIALAVITLFGVYLAVLTVGYAASLVRARRLYESERALLTARIARLTDRFANIERQAAAGAWSGHRKFVLAGKVLEGDDVCSFYLTPHDGQPLPPFLPGQYLTFRMPVAGHDRPETRCYSLSDSPTHPDYYRVTIKRLVTKPDIPGSHDGAVSHHFHQRLAVDDLLDVKAPAGHFYLDPEYSGPVVLTAGGIGITPLLSMLNYICVTGSKRETWFFYGVDHGGQHIMKEYLSHLAAEHENVRLHVCYAEPRDGIDLPGTDYQHGERVSVPLFKRLLPSNNYEFFTCGPAPMMGQLTRELQEWGVPKARIHYEAFGASTAKARRVHVPALGGEPIEVVFARSGNTLLWDGSAGSILDFAEASGIPMESGCRAGNCGSCLTAVRSGQVEYFSEPGAAVEEGSCLTCVSVPRGNLVLDA